MADPIFDKFYSSKYKNPIYTTYLDEQEIQKCVMDFSTLVIIDDKHGHSKSNIRIDSLAKNICSGMDKLNNNTQFYLHSPLATFTKMIKNSGLDIRELIDKKKSLYVEFIVLNRKSYQIKEHKFVSGSQQKVLK